MECRRNALSLTGKNDYLVASGGWDSTTLKTVEEYSILSNDWRPLPELNIARQWAASCVAGNNGNTVFCFCGTEGGDKYLNSIEKLERG